MTRGKIHFEPDHTSQPNANQSTLSPEQICMYNGVISRVIFYIKEVHD